MRTLAAFAVLAVATFATAQSPLLTLTGGTNQGNVGNNIYFDLQVNTTITISRIDFLCGANTVASANGVLDVYLGPTTYVGNTLNQSLWTLAATTGPTTVAPSVMSVGNLLVPLCLGPGNYGVALKSTAFNHGYTNGVCTSTTPGACTNGIFTTAEMTLRAGANQNTAWTSGLNAPRIFNGGLYYTPGGTPIAVASWEKYGQGCYSWYHSFYESYLNPSTSFDLKATSGTNSFRLTNMGSGYLVGPFVTGTGNWWTPGSATNLNMANNTVASVTLPWALPYPTPTGVQFTTTLEVCDNGYVSPAASNGTTANPTVALFLGGQPRWATWFDFNPTLAGQINYELDPSGGAMYITWQGVAEVTTTGTNTWQLAFFANGDVEFRYQTMSMAYGGVNPALVGWTPGGNVMDSGNLDISAITAPFLTGPTDNPPLTLAMAARPQLGTTLSFDSTNIPAGTPFGVLLLGFGQLNPGIPLGVIGMPDCFQLVNLTGSISNLYFPVGSSASVTLPVPNNTAFNGVRLYGQSTSMSGGYNAFGWLSSNGVRLNIGSL